MACFTAYGTGHFQITLQSGGQIPLTPGGFAYEPVLGSSAVKVEWLTGDESGRQEFSRALKEMGVEEQP